MGARVSAADHLGELLTEVRAAGQALARTPSDVFVAHGLLGSPTRAAMALPTARPARPRRACAPSFCGVVGVNSYAVRDLR
jgi:hypothetical protein